ncbi:MAG TPA: hypothetical protein VMY38_02825 [Gemmatimonadaceae bacterium]|nr:hypothetical protein [Gemmatimonadaceae bacterium]
MATQSLPAFCQALAAAPDLRGALGALYAELVANDPGLELALFTYDARKGLLTSRLVAGPAGVTTTPLELSPDHLPAKLKRDVLGGAKLVDFGDLSNDFMKFLSFGSLTTGAFLLLHGLRFDGELHALIAIIEPKRRFGGRATDRMVPLISLFMNAAVRFAEREAREEAVRALEEISEKLHMQYSRTIADLEVQLEDARNAAEGKGRGDSHRVAQLEQAAREAAAQAQTASERLTAVEQQVSAAVSQLEKAHVDMSTQAQQLRTQAKILYRIERLLEHRDKAEDPRKLLDEVVAAVSARE